MRYEDDSAGAPASPELMLDELKTHAQDDDSVQQRAKSGGQHAVIGGWPAGAKQSPPADRSPV